jgi:hypothetical protein
MGKKKTAPHCAAVGTAHQMPDDAIFDQRREGLAVGHVGGDAAFDTQRVPIADLI